VVAASEPRHATAAELKERLSAERSGVPFLVLRDGGGAQQLHMLAPATSRVTIGRAPENDVALPWDPQVSRVHVELSSAGGDWVVDDDGLSRNGTWLNGEKLLRRRRLHDGDVLRVGATHLRFRRPDGRGLGTTVIDTAQPAEASLSPAQRRVLVALCRPLAGGVPGAVPAQNQQIADELFLTVDAVKTHLRALFAKFGVQDLGQNEKRAALAGRALATGAVTLDELGRG